MTADGWAELESALSRHLREHPRVEHALLDSPVEDLNGTDLFLRAAVLEEREGFEAARTAYVLADERAYAPSVRRARDEMLDRVVALVRNGEGTIVDIATGRGALLERLAKETRRALVATDVSSTVLARVRARLGDALAHFVIADARELPFDNDSIATVVSHLGLANVADPQLLLSELRRVSRELVVTHVFYPPNDETNRRAAREYGLDELLFRDSALAALADAGWEVGVDSERAVTAEPTPASALIDGARVDALPVVATELDYCVLVAR